VTVWPRHHAAQLVEAWLTNRPTDPIIQEIPQSLQGLAKQQARNTMHLIKHHGDAIRARRQTIDQVPKAMRPSVQQYLTKASKRRATP